MKRGTWVAVVALLVTTLAACTVRVSKGTRRWRHINDASGYGPGTAAKSAHTARGQHDAKPGVPDAQPAVPDAQREVEEQLAELAEEYRRSRDQAPDAERRASGGEETSARRKPRHRGPSQPKELVGTFGGLRERKGSAADCSFYETLRFSLSVPQSGEIKWMAHAFSDLDCDRGQSIPTSCWYDGVAEVTTSAATGGYSLDLEITGATSTPPPFETHLRRWKCGRAEIVIPAGAEPSGSCVMLGTEETAFSRALTRASEVACQHGQPLRTMTGIVVTVDGSNELSLHLGGKDVLQLQRTRHSGGSGREE